MSVIGIGYDQLRDDDRQGNGTKFQMFGAGTPNAGEIALYDANGNIITSGAKGTTKGDLLAYNGSSWVRLPAGADGNVLTADSTQPAGLKYASGGGGSGGGGSYPYTATITNPPNTFAWVNQGTSTVDYSNGPAYLAAQVSGGGFSLRILKKTIPSYTNTASLTIAYRFLSPGGNSNCFAGVVLRESSSGKLVSSVNAAGGNYQWITWNSPTSGGTNYYSSLGLLQSDLVWERILLDTTNRAYQVSMDGIEWVTVYTGSKTSFITGDEWGFFATGTGAVYLKVLHFAEVTT